MISIRQKQEIDFLRKHFGAKNKKSEEEEYIKQTVRGEESNINNSLFQAKRSLDITIKMWRQDMHDGILAYWELTEDFNCSYADRMVKGIRKGLPKPKPSYGDTGIATIVFLNWDYTGEKTKGGLKKLCELCKIK